MHLSTGFTPQNTAFRNSHRNGRKDQDVVL